jgi:hypothetical protein
MRSNTIQKLAWVYAIMFFFLGSLAHIPWINDAHGMTLGILACNGTTIFYIMLPASGRASQRGHRSEPRNFISNCSASSTGWTA